MGIIINKTYIFTGFDHDTLRLVREKLIVFLRKIRMQSLVTKIYPSVMNCVVTFYIIPDGSYEYWSESEVFDDKMYRFSKWFNAKDRGVQMLCVQYDENHILQNE
jgi:hypothetical protein